jgi:putative endonuclease
MHYVYILQNDKDTTTYIGCTRDLRKRLLEHNSGKSKYTKSRKPWKLLYYEAYNTLNLARKREIELKTNSSEKRKLFVRIFNNKAPSSSG